MKERFVLQESTTPEWYVVTDTANNIVVRFQNHRFNDTQQVTLLDGDTFKTEKEAIRYATYIRELADWLRDNHYNKVF